MTTPPATTTDSTTKSNTQQLDCHVAQKAITHLRTLDRVLVALSGGIDSMTLLALAKHAGLSHIEAVTGVSASVAAFELNHATALCKALDVVHHRAETYELQSADYTRNTPDRCFHCKSELYKKLRRLADKLDIQYIIDGTSAADLHGHRPGHQAALNNHIVSPWVNAGAHKNDIRSIAQSLNINHWDKSSSPCLASRIAYGLDVTTERLRQVEHAEAFLKHLGFKKLRVRHHNTTARIEVPSTALTAVCRHADKIAAHLKTLGFTYITLDLAGLRSGSLLEVLPS